MSKRQWVSQPIGVGASLPMRPDETGKKGTSTMTERQKLKEAEERYQSLYAISLFGTILSVPAIFITGDKGEVQNCLVATVIGFAFAVSMLISLGKLAWINKRRFDIMFPND